LVFVKTFHFILTEINKSKLFKIVNQFFLFILDFPNLIHWRPRAKKDLENSRLERDISSHSSQREKKNKHDKIMFLHCIYRKLPSWEIDISIESWIFVGRQCECLDRSDKWMKRFVANQLTRIKTLKKLSNLEIARKNPFWKTVWWEGSFLLFFLWKVLQMFGDDHFLIRCWGDKKKDFFRKIFPNFFWLFRGSKSPLRKITNSFLVNDLQDERKYQIIFSKSFSRERIFQNFVNFPSSQSKNYSCNKRQQLTNPKRKGKKFFSFIFLEIISPSFTHVRSTWFQKHQREMVQKHEDFKKEKTTEQAFRGDHSSLCTFIALIPKKRIFPSKIIH